MSAMLSMTICRKRAVLTGQWSFATGSTAEKISTFDKKVLILFALVPRLWGFRLKMASLRPPPCIEGGVNVPSHLGEREWHEDASRP